MTGIIQTLLFTGLVPYAQIFFVDYPLSLIGISVSPSLFIAALVLFAVKKDYGSAYTFAFLSGITASVINGMPLGAVSISYLLVVMLVRKFSGNFDTSGVLGQFVLGFAASVFNVLFAVFAGLFFEAPHTTFFAAGACAVLTGIFSIIAFAVFFGSHKTAV